MITIYIVFVSQDKVYVTNVDNYINANNNHSVEIYLINNNVFRIINMLKQTFKNITVNLWNLIKLGIIWKCK